MMEDLIGKVLDKIKSDETAADLQWSLFQSALCSYRRDSVLRPFPSALLSSTASNEEKDFTALVRWILKLQASVSWDSK